MKKSDFFYLLDSSNDKNSLGSIMIVDGTNLFIRSFSSYPTLNDLGVHIGGFFGFFDTLTRMVSRFNVSELCVCFDGDNSSSRRKNIYSGYKANRKANTKLNRTIMYTAEEEKELLEMQMEMVLYYLNKMPVKLFQLSGVESDDVISYITRNYYKERENLYILSSDKDFMQLVDDRVTLISPVKRKGSYPVYNTKDILKKYNVHPNNMVIARAFEGDTSDNIKGVRGIGIPTLLKYFPELGEEKVYDLDYILQKSDTLLKENKKSKKLRNITESRDIIELNLELMDLRNDNQFSIRNIEAIDSIISKEKEKPDFKKLRSMVRNHGLSTCILQLRRVPFIEFLRPIFSLFNKK